jgi:hypothetical protein
MDHERATSGEVRISNIKGLGGSVTYRWMIEPGTNTEPQLGLLVRCQDNGQWTLAVEERWTDITLEDNDNE